VITAVQFAMHCMMITGVIQTFAICRLYRFHWPWFSL